MTDPRRRRFIKASGTAALAGLTGLSGCTGGSDDGSSGESGDGSGGDGDSGGDGGDGGSDGGTTGESSGSSGTFTIAATLPETGPFSSIAPDLRRGYEMGVARMNENGGLNGQEVELLVGDDESSPEVVRERLKQLLSNNDVDMIWGSFAGVLVTATAAIAEQEEIPMLGVAFSDDKLHEDRGYEWTFVPFPKSSDHVKGTKAVLELIPEADRPTRIGQWVPNTSWSIEMADMWDETLGAAGFETVFRETHQLHASDFSSLISQSEEADVDILLGTPAPDGGITAMKQINESNFEPKFVQFTRAADTAGWWNALGEAGQHVVMAPGWVPGMTGNGNAEMSEAYYDSYDVSEDNLPSVMTGASYNLTQVAEQAVSAAGSNDKAAVRDALRNGSFQTVSGEFEFDDVGRPVGLTSPMGQWIEGDQHLIYPETDSEAHRDLIFPIER